MTRYTPAGRIRPKKSAAVLWVKPIVVISICICSAPHRSLAVFVLGGVLQPKHIDLFDGRRL
jgi:hypothetical protein